MDDGRISPARSVTWHLARINAARAVAPPGSAPLAEFMAALDEVNALAEASPGFVWRLQDADGNVTAYRPVAADPLQLLNVSVWEDIDALRAYTYQSAHTAYLRRRLEWFERPVPGQAGAHLAMWWVPAGHRPEMGEAWARLLHLRAHGPTPHAFTFARPFASDGTPLTARTDGATAAARGGPD